MNGPLWLVQFRGRPGGGLLDGSLEVITRPPVTRQSADKRLDGLMI